jgi:hypothetical protein
LGLSLFFLLGLPFDRAGGPIRFGRLGLTLLLERRHLPAHPFVGSGSDIRPFLASGVPADVTRAALRRAWSTDPAIREFIGLSENSWDFNAPGGVSGFGPLTTDASSRLLARTMEETESFDPERPVPSG